MKPLCAVLLLVAMSVPGCSRFTKTGRMDRAYYKQMKQVKVAREKHRKMLVEHQRAQMPPPPNSPPSLPQTTVQTTSESQ